MARRKGILGWIILILLIAGAVFFYLRFYYVFSDGTKTGELNTFAKTGYVFKTYEGEMMGDSPFQAVLRRIAVAGL